MSSPKFKVGDKVILGKNSFYYESFMYFYIGKQATITQSHGFKYKDDFYYIIDIDGETRSWLEVDLIPMLCPACEKVHSNALST